MNLLQNYKKSLTLVDAKGCYLFDNDGVKYLDMYSGVCVSNLGHCPDGWSDKITEVGSKCIHTSNYYYNQNEIELSTKLSELVSGSIPNAKVLFCNSGTEANEGALKLAILQNQHTSSEGNILAFKGSFHGRTIGSLAVTSSQTYREPFKMMMSSNVFFWEYNKTEGLETFMEENNIRIVITEIVQGEGGVIPMKRDFSELLINLQAKRNFMLIVDEIQTGMCRCGEMFIHQEYGFKPDFLCIAKALGNGIPIGSVLMKNDTVVKPGQHGSTFGGNPFATGMANWVIDQMVNGNLCDKVKRTSNHVVAMLKEIQEQVPHMIVDVRHKGLLIGVEFNSSYPVSSVIEKLKENKILCITAGVNTLRLCPPLTSTIDEVDEFLSALRYVLGIHKKQARRPKLVWKISGDIDDTSYLKLLNTLKVWSITHDIAIVFGAGTAINTKLKEQNITVEYVNGQRKTCEATMNIVEIVAMEQQKRLLKLAESMLSMEATTKPVFSASKPLEHYGFVLEPEFSDISEITKIWQRGNIALVSFLSTYEGKTYNSNADLCLSCLSINVDADFVAYSVSSHQDVEKVSKSSQDIHSIETMINKSDSNFSEGFKMKIKELKKIFENSNTSRAFIGTNADLPTKPNSFLRSSSLMIRKSGVFNVGLIGSRGFIGGEIAKYIESNPKLIIHRFSLPQSPVVDESKTKVIKLHDWNDINNHTYIDSWISSCPNDVLKTNIHLIDPSIPIIDVSSDFRHVEGWEYGMCYINENVKTHRISNAGCYSSAAITALHPIVKHARETEINITSYVTGISSYSGAGKNYLVKFPTLHNSLLPYNPLVHTQQEEMSNFLNSSVRFVPIITDQFERGMLCSIMVELDRPMNLEVIKQIYDNEYKNNKFVKCLFDKTDSFVTIDSVVGTTNITLSNLSLSNDGKTIHIQSMIDNLTVGGGFSSYLNTCRLLGIEHDNIVATNESILLNYDDYVETLDYPLGFHAATTNVPFVSREIGKKKVMQFSCLRMDTPSKWTATYTNNPICGNPVIIGRDRLKGGKPIKAVWINNKISNVGVKEGLRDAEDICETFANEFGCEKDSILPLSTGIIGWRLPTCDMIKSTRQITRGDVTVAELARAIMTTDAYPKAYREVLSNGASIVGVAKGAGMIEPNMATTIIILMTDADMDQSYLDTVLKRVVDETFNCISIDSDTSTSDCCVLISSGKKSKVPESEFEESLKSVCAFLARQIVWNGEGIQHAIEIKVRNAPSAQIAKQIGKNIVNSPLIKTAINGNDPNVGRIIGAMARNISDVNWSVVDVKLGDYYIMTNGFVKDWNTEIEKVISDYMRSCQIYVNGHKPTNPVHNKSVVIDLDLKCGDVDISVIGGDLSVDYVNINGDYRS